MRTIRALRPRSFLGVFLTFSFPLAVLGIAFAAASPTLSPVAWSLFALSLIARVALHVAHRARDVRTILADLWLLPLNDILICWVWLRSLFTSRISWCNNQFDVGADGVMRPWP
jgi:hypothetical protein